MPRGRKPIPRSRDEALEARREQIRRNVQAFRERKRRAKEDEKNDETPGEPSEEVPRTPTVLDPSTQLVPSPSLALRQLPCSSKEEAPTVNAASTNSQASTSQVRAATTSAISQSSHLTVPGAIRGLQPLPPAIDNAFVLRRQFLANASLLFVPEGQLQLNRTCGLGPHWAQDIPCVGMPSKFLEQSLETLCLLQVAHLRQDRNFVMASRHSYGQALQALRIQSHSRNIPWKEVFLAAMILGVCELLYGTNGGSAGFQYHLRGASSYLRRFTRYDESLTDQIYFYYLEAECVFNALALRKRSSLSPTTWWKCSIDRCAGKPYGSLLHLITPLPAFLEQFDHLIGLPSNPTTQARKLMLLDRGFLMEDELKDWFDDVSKNVPDFSYDDGGDFVILSDIPATSPSDVQYTFPSVLIARLYLLYWASVVLLFESLIALVHDLSEHAIDGEDQIPVRGPLPSVHVLENMIAQAKIFATNIRRSVAFCLYPRNGIMGKSVILLPLWVARKHLRQADEEQARWCTAVLRRIGQDHYDV